MFKPTIQRGAIIDAVVVIVLGIVAVIPLLNCIALPVSCVVALVLPLAVGWLVAQWGGLSQTVDGLKDGALATGAGHLVGGIVVFILNLLLGGIFAAMGAAGGGDAGSAATGFAVGAGAGIVGLILGAIFGAAFGAVGGLLYVVIQGSKKATA